MDENDVSMLPWLLVHNNTVPEMLYYKCISDGKYYTSVHFSSCHVMILMRWFRKLYLRLRDMHFSLYLSSIRFLCSYLEFIYIEDAQKIVLYIMYIDRTYLFSPRQSLSYIIQCSCSMGITWWPEGRWWAMMGRDGQGWLEKVCADWGRVPPEASSHIPLLSTQIDQDL